MLYVLAIRNNTSGGSETLHQFAAKVKKCGGDVAMYYPDDTEKVGTPAKFKIYNLAVVTKIEDSSENVLLVPETETKYLFKFKNIKKCIWWLSLDNYYGFTTITGLIRSAQRHNIPKIFYPLYCPVIFLKKKLTPNYYHFNNMHIDMHLYNCEYVKTYLKEKGINKNNYLYLCGPIREDFFVKSKNYQKQEIVIYNPKKNYEFTKQVIKRLQKARKSIKCIPIQNMTPTQIVELMDSAKVYIDFGQFPGPERIPREAVTRNCNIITSLYGSARNNDDVLVPKKFKIDAKKKNLDVIVSKVLELLDNYDYHVGEYDAYRKKVINQKDIFEKNTQIFIDRFNILK